ncbi:hypothetical protein BU24DRAFT_419845 [Aaosphaeria arxii CBS 175.79]|uniref:Uncharacterized protein n=1 Tax=Aaosphaeria arxii CBS 175.79 TaxID=1450172 RepID=A0A6A5Y422_9PLEO|nr:uncharacterized protein BU24DRAFT_419845 [Aaosphaeria arxii CBS 175.79]KAF2020302.1 hypothetical protein BU24DRAFT_419845 [Aaosphaeria arxii CBS 175.79]
MLILTPYRYGPLPCVLSPSCTHAIPDGTRHLKHVAPTGNLTCLVLPSRATYHHTACGAMPLGGPTAVPALNDEFACG